MRVTDDAMQDAWVALLERGGPSSVENVDKWLWNAAKQAQAKAAIARTYQLTAEYEYNGFSEPDCMTALRAHRSERNRVFHLLHPEARNERWQRYKAKETPEQREHRLQVMRNWRARQRKKKPTVEKPTHCAHCGDPLVHLEGRKPKKYCDHRCNQADYGRRKRVAALCES